MASTLRLHLPFHYPHHNNNTTTTINPKLPKFNPVRCGPRSNRGPLHKGRTLSIEAIQAVQSLKRTHNSSDPTKNDTVSRTLSRLIKPDLIATFNELLRQDQITLALKVFQSIKFEHWYKTDLNLYAKLITALTNKGMFDEIDRLIGELEPGDVVPVEGKGVVTVVKALVGGGRVEAVVRVYEMMKVGGWRCEDEYVGRVLSKGLRRLGEGKVADEIDVEIGRVCGGVLEKMGG